MAYGGQKRACALCRTEYVKSKDPVNASRGRETSGVAGEAKLRELGYLCLRCHNFFHFYRFRSDFFLTSTALTSGEVQLVTGDHFYFLSPDRV